MRLIRPVGTGTRAYITAHLKPMGLVKALFSFSDPHQSAKGKYSFAVALVSFNCAQVSSPRSRALSQQVECAAPTRGAVTSLDAALCAFVSSFFRTVLYLRCFIWVSGKGRPIRCFGKGSVMPEKGTQTACYIITLNRLWEASKPCGSDSVVHVWTQPGLEFLFSAAGGEAVTQS